MKKNKTIRKTILILIIIILGGIYSLLLTRIKPRAPITFPLNEIVFQKGASEFSHEVGFINADGSDENSIKVKIYNIWGGIDGIKFPILSKDGSLLIFRNKGNADMLSPTVIRIFQSDKPAQECDELYFGTFRPQFTNNESALFVDLYNPEEAFAIIDSKSCEIIQSFENKLFSLEPGSGNLSPDGNYIVYDNCCSSDHSPQISLLDLGTKKEKLIGEGAFPVWSPDGEQISYTGMDGIYIYDVKSEITNRIIEYRNPESTRAAAYLGAWPVMVSWSPSGDRLVYHKCLNKVNDITNNCDDIEEFAIFIFNVKSGEEMKITDNGINPYWVK